MLCCRNGVFFVLEPLYRSKPTPGPDESTAIWNRITVIARGINFVFYFIIFTFCPRSTSTAKRRRG